MSKPELCVVKEKPSLCSGIRCSFKLSCCLWLGIIIWKIIQIFILASEILKKLPLETLIFACLLIIWKMLISAWFLDLSFCLCSCCFVLSSSSMEFQDLSHPSFCLHGRLHFVFSKGWQELQQCVILFFFPVVFCNDLLCHKITSAEAGRAVSLGSHTG